MRQVFIYVTILLAIAVPVAAQDLESSERGPSTAASSEAIFDRSRIDRTFNASLAELLTRYPTCSAGVREFIGQLQLQNDPSREYVFVSPIPQPEPKSAPDRQCLGRAARLRRQFAEQLVRLAKLAVKANPNLAFRLLNEASLHDPNHRLAKAITRNRVHAKIDVKARAGRTAYPEFGWPKGKYFVVNSPNYSIVSNAEKANVTRLAENLELLNAAWRQVFFEHWSSTRDLARAISRVGAPRMPKDTFRIVLFASKEDYVNVIRRYEKRARITQGIYIPKTRVAYFHCGDDDELGSTWKHEATHQLFAETGRGVRDASLIDNFWLLEGLATYMESLQLRPGYSMVGGLEADRLQFARYRTLGGIGAVSLQTLTAMSQRELQQRNDIPVIYSQSAGVTHFLVRNHRNAFMRYVDAVYSGRDTKGTLTAATGLTFDELEDEYKRYLMIDDAGLRSLDSRATIRNLSLACTKATDAAVKNIPLENVHWFDLGLTSVTDDGLVRLGTATKLTQLSLFHTKITDVTVRRLANASELVEIDLSGTSITDASVPILMALPKLKSVDLADTKLSAGALQKIRSRFPSTD